MADNAEDTEELTPKDKAVDAAEGEKRAQRKGIESRLTADKPVAAQRNHPDADSAGNVPAEKDLTATFLKLSGYKEADLLGSNQARRTFVTTNGGKYVVKANNKGLRVLQGPPTPKMIKDAAAAEEDDEE